MEWLIPGGAVATLAGLLIGAVKLGWVEIPAARVSREAQVVDTATELIALVRGQMREQSERIERLERAWQEHRVWDVEIRAELRRIDPAAYDRVGPPPRLPFD